MTVKMRWFNKINDVLIVNTFQYPINKCSIYSHGITYELKVLNQPTNLQQCCVLKSIKITIHKWKFSKDKKQQQLS